MVGGIERAVIASGPGRAHACRRARTSAPGSVSRAPAQHRVKGPMSVDCAHNETKSRLLADAGQWTTSNLAGFVW